MPEAHHLQEFRMTVLQYGIFLSIQTFMALCRFPIPVWCQKIGDGEGFGYSEAMVVFL
jgi:hypothetical protein